MHFFNISPNLCYKTSREFINFNIMMWDIEANNLDPEKTLK